MKINFDKKAKSLLAVYAILLFVFVILFAVIPFRKIATSWIAFVFCIASIVIGFFITIYAFKKDEELVSKIYGFPIFRIGAIYTIAQLIVGIVFCAICAFVTIPSWVVLVLSVIMLAAAAIGVIATDNTRDIIKDQDTSVAESTKQVTLFNMDIAGIVDCCGKSELKADLEKLAEDFKYSDPVSSDVTMEIEAAISDKIRVLKETLSTDSIETLKTKITDIKNMLSERNRICKASKRS